MEFGMDKCSSVRINKRKIRVMADVGIPDGKQMKQIEDIDYKYLGIIQDSEIKAQVMKNKIRTTYLRRVRKLLKLELYVRHMFMEKNKRALGVVRYIAETIY